MDKVVMTKKNIGFDITLHGVDYPEDLVDYLETEPKEVPQEQEVDSAWETQDKLIRSIEDRIREVLAKEFGLEVGVGFDDFFDDEGNTENGDDDD